MASDGKIVWEVTVDDKNVVTGLKKVTADIKTESKKWDTESKTNLDKMEANSKSTASVMESAFTGAFIAITNALVNVGVTFMAELGKWIAASIDVASSLEEVQNVVDMTFGEQGAAKIEAWSKKAGSQFGLTELQAKKFTATMGAMLKSSGLTGDEIVNMSTDLAGLAADMASFYNLDFDTAFAKIRSGMSGETEPLKQLGVNMSVANMNEFLKSQGIETEWKDMTQVEQTMTRYQYLLKATADAQGDFARTADDSYANINRQIETQMENAQANIGEGLLPIAKQLKQEWLELLKVLNGDTGVRITGSQDQLQGWLANAETTAADARKELDSLGDSYGKLVDVSREDFEPGVFDNYGEFVLQNLYTRQQWARGEERGKIDAAISAMETAQKKVTEAEGEISNYQAQLNQLATETPDTATAGAQIITDLTNGMASQEGALQSEVDRINGILGGIGSGAGVGGVDIPIDGSYATGLNWVPFDGFLAQLHEGEGILTAEENKIWQRFKSRSSGFDYDTIGGVMRDNVKAGGNVYLDGKIVGNVISDRQGRSYKSLQRSGWQA